MRTRELVEKGVDPRIAREMVLARIGDASRLKRTCVDLGRKRDREMRLTQWLDERRRRREVRVAAAEIDARLHLVAAITLALGIGANSAMFALADATLIRPLPFPHADRLVMVWESKPDGLAVPMAPATLRRPGTSRISPSTRWRRSAGAADRAARSADGTRRASTAAW